MAIDHRIKDWAKGANNMARPGRLPDGFVREAVNFDARPTGELVLRPGYAPVYAGTDVRFAHALGQDLIVVDGTSLKVVDMQTATATKVRTVAGAGPVVGDAIGDVLYMATANETLCVENQYVRRWGVPAPSVAISLTTGSLAAGVYKVAATNEDAMGNESGAAVKTIRIADGQGMRVTTSSPTSRVYVSAVDSAELYFQANAYGGAVLVSSVYDDSERLTTEWLVPPPLGDSITAFRSVLLIARDNYVMFTVPFSPHLHDPLRGFFSFPATVTNVVRTTDGVYITADKTYFLREIETATPELTTVAEHGAVAGTGVTLPDGRAAWFTEYGQAIGSPRGEVEFPNKNNYAPQRATHGAAGVVEHQGGHTVVTTMRAGGAANSAATTDYCDLEIVKL